MGGTMNRSSYENDDRSMYKEIPEQSYIHSDVTVRSGSHLRHHSHHNHNRHTDLTNIHVSEDKTVDQQKMNITSGSTRVEPFSVSGNYLSDPALYQTEKHAHHTINSFYPENDTLVNKIRGVVTEERLSKRGGSSSSTQQHERMPSSNPSSNIQSMHESNSIPNDKVMLTATQSVSSTNRSSLRQHTSHVSHTPVEKPVYVGIDHKATLLERNRVESHVHHRKNGQRHHSDGFNSVANSERMHGHSVRHLKRYNSTDSTSDHIQSISNSFFNPVAKTLSNSHNTVAKPVLTSKRSHTIELTFPNTDRKTRSSNSKGERRLNRQKLAAVSWGPAVNAESSGRQFENRHANSLIKRMPPY